MYLRIYHIVSLIFLVRLCFSMRPGEAGYPDFVIQGDHPIGAPENQYPLRRYSTKLTYPSDVDVWKVGILTSTFDET